MNSIAGDERIRILVVDDHPLFRRGVVATLNTQSDMKVVGEASNGHEALERIREFMPDLILMDIQMPGCDGLEATRLIMDEMPYARIVMLTVSDDDRHLFEAIKAGAQGYLLKNLEPEDLVDMVWGVFRGEAPISRTTASRILREFVRLTRKDQPAPIPGKHLTDREREILQLVAEGKTNREIGEALFVTENTVKNHLRNILEKLHLRNRVQAAVYAVQQGLAQGQLP
jgi:DNA-binding NarL/FixJ family response regulator